VTAAATKRTAALVAGLLALSLTACGKNDNRTAGEKVDAGIAKTEQAMDNAKAKTEQMASDAKAKTDQSTSTMGEKVDDAQITASVSAGLAKDSELSAIKINVDTKSGNVMLNGPAPTAAAKARAEEIAKSVKGVNTVDNKLEVKTM
jgi:osmotically-inducible protein OsmY